MSQGRCPIDNKLYDKPMEVRPYLVRFPTEEKYGDPASENAGRIVYWLTCSTCGLRKTLRGTR